MVGSGSPPQKLAALRSTQNSDFYTIGQAFFLFLIFAINISQLENTEKTNR